MPDPVLPQDPKKTINDQIVALWSTLQGKKTYIVAGTGVVVAFVGCVFGPVDIPVGQGVLSIPHVSAPDAWHLLWKALMMTCIRHGISTKA